MNTMSKNTVALLLCGLTKGAFALSPVGAWLTIDDHTKKPRSTVEITEQNGVYFGQITHIIKTEGDTGICSECPGQFKDQKILGLQILWGLQKKSETQYTEGKILDPKSGHVYKCTVTLADDGKSLQMRGFIGMPLFGRSQVWTRVSTDEKNG